MARLRATQDGDEVSRWQGLIGEWERAGTSAREFCREAGIAYSTFYLWRRRLGRVRSSGPAIAPRQSASPTRSFIALGPGAVALPAAYGERDAMGGQIDLRIELGGGVVLHLRRG